MYRDVLYHIFEGYSLFINEYDFEEFSDTSILMEKLQIFQFIILLFLRKKDMQKGQLLPDFDGKRTHEKQK